MDLQPYIAIPFRDHGRDFNGCDCWGLVRLLFREERGILLPSLGGQYADTQDAEDIGRLMAGESRGWEEITEDVAARWDVIMLRIARWPIHLGVVLRSGEFIHAARGKGVAVERWTRPRWRNQVLGFWRYDAARSHS